MMLNINGRKTLLCGLVAAFASFSTQLQADDSELELGQELFEEFCAGCHGADASGLSQFSDDLSTFGERLEGVTENMPDFAGVFDDDEVAAIFAFLDQATSGE
jgi:mono/diheme cytochrome c family protein